ncbi:uncharacterized protein [Chironomus tepperi]|uniref:uncharacterized protein isoform X1 n=1 Tax=Chironomus tepperi TaxID=113505 RepID=UPI00391EFC4F
MLTKTIQSLTILTILISSSHQLQNLCGTDPTVTNVPDPSSCHLFITCDRNYNPVRPRSGSCYGTGADYVITDQNNRVWCTPNDGHCTDPLWACPPEPEHDIMVADPNDQSCRRFRQCRNLSGNFTSCAYGLVFNRNTGQCDYSSNAPCTRVSLPVVCPANYTGFYPGFQCYEYVYCQDGDVLLKLQCSDRMYFDWEAKSCLYDDYGICPRTKGDDGDVKAFLIKN